MRHVPFLFVLAALVSLAAPSGAAAPPNVTRVRIVKGQHLVQLYSGAEVVRSYSAAIGPGGVGYKHREGDKVTPVGHYHLAKAVPSQFHKFLRVDYPNAEDWKRFAALKADGTLPKDATIGGDIGLHGVGSKDLAGLHKKSDWTLGCIALDDEEIDEIASRVKDGTRVIITD